MKKALSLLAVFLIAAMWSVTGFSADKYVSGNIGITWFDDSPVEHTFFNNDFLGIDGNVGLDSGLALMGALGCDWGDYRIEGELGYQSSDFKTLVIGGPGIDELEDFINNLTINGEDIDLPNPIDIDLEGDLDVITLLFNGYYDIDLGGVELFLTAGAGAAQIESHNVALKGVSDIPTQGEIPDFSQLGLSISENVFAYQIGAGLGIPVADNIMLDVKYRYFATRNFTIDADVGVGGGVSFPDGENGGGNGLPEMDPVLVGVVSSGINTSISNHSALLGLRVNF
ncbi:MAG: outer membrane beta-barrel protein [Chlorobiales bacterium]|nr:outer membrane beta-barrel protein [Chlorobiales bacterium]